MTTRELRDIGSDILSRGRVDTNDLDRLHAAVYVGGQVSREAADFLVGLHRQLERPAGPAFRQLVRNAVKAHVLNDGRVAAEEAAWLRTMVFADGTVQDEERTLLRELRGEATAHSPEFDALFAEVEETPPESRTSGRTHR